MDQIKEFFKKLLDSSDWPPRWHCGKWTEFHGWLYIISDLLIWSAYFAIPVVILRFISKKQDARFIKLYLLFAAFILACGATHFLDAIAFWIPVYRLNALVRFATGVVSWVTVFYIIRYLPAAFSLRSQKDLEAEIEQRKKAEAQVWLLNAELEKKVTERTAVISASNERFNLISKATNDILWDWDLKDDQLWWNENYYTLFGYQRNRDLTAYNSRYEGIHPLDKDRIVQGIRKVIETGQHSWSGEYRFLKADGSSVYIFDRGYLLYDPEGKAYRMTGAMQDITGRKKAEELIEKNEFRFRNTLDKMLEGVQIIGFDWRYIYVNDAMAKHGKYPKEELLGHTVMEKYPGIEQTEIYKVYQRCYQERVAIHLENEFIFPDKSKGWFELNFQPVPEGIFILSVDITDRKKAEEKLVRSEEIYRTIASSIPGSVICLLDADYRYLLIEGDMLGKLGYSKEILLGNKVQDVMPPENYTGVKPALERVFNGEIFTTETTGPDYDIVSRFVPLKDQDNQVYAAMIVLFDVSELKNAQRRIAELNIGLELKVVERTRQLEEVNKELESFSYSVSHDLRAPLRAITGYTTILLEDYAAGLEEEGRRLAGQIVANSKKMGQLIDDLLDFSRLGRKEITPSLVPMNGLVQSVLSEVLSNGSENKYKVRVHELPDTEADPAMIRQVWVNLLDNAVKYSSRKEKPEIEIGSINDPVSQIYYIKDNGAGFDMQYAHKLFGVFQRLHRSSEFPGTGVGLALAQRIIQKHHGKIWTEAVQDQGATFYFSLPKKAL